MSERLVTKIEDFQQAVGLPIIFKGLIPTAELLISYGDQSRTEVARATIYGQPVLLVNTPVQRGVTVVIKLASQYQLPVVLLVSQLTAAVRRNLIQHEIAFATVDGEAMLPFLAVRLKAIQKSNSQPKLVFDSNSQKLVLLILMAQLIYQRFGTSKLKQVFGDSMVAKHGSLEIRGGQTFIETIGKSYDFNTRMTFTRAVESLVTNELVKPQGQTKNRFYTCQLAPTEFFDQAVAYLQNPLMPRKKLWLSETGLDKLSIDTLQGGVAALAKVTMISAGQADDNWLVVPRKQWQGITTSNISAINQQSTVQIQASKYDLQPFNTLYRQFDAAYPVDIPDPFHLYLMFSEDPNERIQGEVLDLIDRIWGT